jgi:hypothetical protein
MRFMLYGAPLFRAAMLVQNKMSKLMGGIKSTSLS